MISIFSIIIVNYMHKELKHFTWYFAVPACILLFYLIYTLYDNGNIEKKSRDKRFKLFFVLAIIINVIGGYLIAHSKGII